MNPDKDQLTLNETEQLCMLYLDCRLTVLEEAELRYILDRFSYSSPVINEAREMMMAEGLLVLKSPKTTSVSVKEAKHPHVRKLHLWHLIGLAASIAVLIAVSVIVLNSPGGYISGKDDSLISQASTPSSDAIFIAYENGKRLDQESSREAVSHSLQRAEDLIAMANAREREEEARQNAIINLTSGIK